MFTFLVVSINIMGFCFCSTLALQYMPKAAPQAGALSSGVSEPFLCLLASTVLSSSLLPHYWSIRGAVVKVSFTFESPNVTYFKCLDTYESLHLPPSITKRNLFG